MANSQNNSPASVRQRLLNLAREKGQVFDVVLVTYGLERLMYRLSLSEHRDSFVLKGGLLVTLWIGDEHRVTRDADFLGFGEASEERLIAVFSEILSLPPCKRRRGEVPRDRHPGARQQSHERLLRSVGHIEFSTH